MGIKAHTDVSSGVLATWAAWAPAEETFTPMYEESSTRSPQPLGTPREPAPQQASAIPFRWKDGQLEVCLITARRNPHKWIVPKGLIEEGDTPGQTALKEAQEEAGLLGRLIPEPLGQYQYKKLGRWLSVQVYAMEVHESQERWQEAKRRLRCWVEPEQAMELLSTNKLKAIFALALDRIAAPTRPAES